jgi:penicillin-binding protein 1A
MVAAVAKRPVEQFETKATLPDWQLEPDEETWLGEPGASGMMVDQDGNPLPSSDPNAPPFADPLAGRDGEKMDQQWIERQIAPRSPPAPRPRNDGAPPAMRGLPKDSEPAEAL